MFVGFDSALPKCACGQAPQEIDVRDDRARLPEGPYQVLAFRQVQAGLASHRGVDHRQQGRRHLIAGDTTHEAGRHKARQIPDHAATEGDHRRPAVESVGRQCPQKPLIGSEGLGSFTGCYGIQPTPFARPFEGLEELLCIERGDPIVRHHGHSGFGHQAGHLNERPRAHPDLIGGRNVDGYDYGAVSTHVVSFSTISSTTSSEFRPSVETSTAATSR